MTSFQREDVLDSCALFGSMLNLPTGIDRRKIMAAIASNESSTGANCGPRREPAYDVGGSLSTRPQQAAALKKYGSVAPCSYGPWQMMFVNFSPEAQNKIATGTVGIDDYALEFVKFFNAYVIGARKAKTLQDIGQVWNLGHISQNPPASVVDYCKKLHSAYDAA